MLMALKPFLHICGKIKEINVSTYQAASGAGIKGIQVLENELQFLAEKHLSVEKDNYQIVPDDKNIFGRQYMFNAFSHNSDVDIETGYNGEEMKMVNETRKILGDDGIIVNPTCVRIPTVRSHMESIQVEFENDVDIDVVRDFFGNRNFDNVTYGVQLLDNRENNLFPEPLITQNEDDVFVGRLRYCLDSDKNPIKNKIQLLASGDQIRKGAALNSIQIYESLFIQ
jgi:aspartate-semialdehyde dehydrogenase